MCLDSGKVKTGFGVIRVFKDRLEVRLWRRAHFCLGEAEFIFGDGEREVCDGAHSLFVMKKSGRFKNSLYAAGVPTRYYFIAFSDSTKN